MVLPTFIDALATCSICTTKVGDLAMHIMARHSKPTVSREARDLTREGLGEEEKMEFTNIKMRVVGHRITETLRLERFVVTTQEKYTGIMGKSKLNKTTENIEALQMVHNDLEEYVIRKEGAKVLFTSTQAKRLYFKLNKKKGRDFQEVVPYQFVEKLLERYHKEGLVFPCVKEEPAEDAGGVPEPSTSVLRKRKIRGFEEEGRRDPLGPGSRPATRPLMVGHGRREEGEEENPTSTRRVSTERLMRGNREAVERLDNLRLRIQQQIQKINNESS